MVSGGYGRGECEGGEGSAPWVCEKTNEEEGVAHFLTSLLPPSPSTDGTA